MYISQPRWLSGLTRSRVHSLWLLVDHCVLRNWDRILVRAVKGLISRAGMVSICPLLWQRDVKLQQTNKTYNCIVGGWECICAQNKHKIRHFRPQKNEIRHFCLLSFPTLSTKYYCKWKKYTCSCVNVSRLSSRTISKYNVAIPRYHHQCPRTSMITSILLVNPSLLV